MNILGINAFHGDAAAALIQNGQLIVAVEEERFNRIKHWAGFPTESIQSCLATAGLTIGEVDRIGISSNAKANLTQKLQFTLRQRPTLSSLLDRLNKQNKSTSIQAYLAIAGKCQPEEITAHIHHLEHHSTHLASTFSISPFLEAAILSVDGMGDFVSTVMAAGRDNDFTYFSRTYFPHSLGYLYNAITLYLGFPNYGDEFKIMGLAPYGEPEYLPAFRRLIQPTKTGFELNLDYFNHHHSGISITWNDSSPLVTPFHSNQLEQLFGPSRHPLGELTQKHYNIANSLQAVTEEIIFHLLNLLHQHYPSDNLCLSGGVAMNSVANGKITQHTPFKNIYIPVGAADNGTAIGAGFYIWNQILNQPRNFVLEHAYWGCEFSDAECLASIRAIPELCAEYLPESELLNTVVADLCDGKVVGWFQGRMEFGARALGNRSLLADPRRADMRDTINLKIKFREKFRPFAPSILAEQVGEYFEVDTPVPFMEKVYQIRPEKHQVIPAVTHVDGTGRLQSVSRTTNPRYWKLIDRFFAKTGVPVLLNTSLNENEPIVRTPAEAIQCFQRTGMDVLVLSNYYLKSGK